MKKRILILIIILITGIQLANVYAQQRFPKPEFESGHTQPPTLTPEPRATLLEYLDMVVLFGRMKLAKKIVC